MIYYINGHCLKQCGMGGNGGGGCFDDNEERLRIHTGNYIL